MLSLCRRPTLARCAPHSPAPDTPAVTNAGINCSKNATALCGSPYRASGNAIRMVSTLSTARQCRDDQPLEAFNKSPAPTRQHHGQAQLRGEQNPPQHGSFVPRCRARRPCVARPAHPSRLHCGINQTANKPHRTTMPTVNAATTPSIRMPRRYVMAYLEATQAHPTQQKPKNAPRRQKAADSRQPLHIRRNRPPPSRANASSLCATRLGDKQARNIHAAINNTQPVAASSA